MMLEKYYYKGQVILPPKADIVFKAVFGAEGSKDFLATFLKDMLDLDIAGGDAIELLNTELIPIYENGKLVRLDVRARLGSGEQVDVEIQVNDEGDIIPRNVFCNDRLFISQLKKGEGYGNLRKTINLVIMDFNLFKDSENWYNTFRYKNVETGEELTTLKELTFVELPKWLALKRSPGDILQANDRLSRREMWNLFLSTNSGEVLGMLANKDETMQQVIEKLMEISADEKLKYEYDQRLISELDHISRMQNAEEKGLKRGMEQGLERGKIDKAVEIALKMKASGMSYEEIAEMTERPIEEIENLKG